MSGTLRIDEPSGPRFDLALDLLEAGQYFVFIDCGLRIEDGVLQVLVPTQWEPHSISEPRALEELRRAERNIASLASASPRFAAIAANLPKVFILVYDYGTSGLWLCRLREGAFEWYEGYQRK
jgi:hypothetical protein